MIKWVPYPRYIFRKELAISLIKKNFPKNKSFLEIGCASGDFGITLSKMGYKGLMIDFSDESSDYTKKSLKERKIKNLEFLKTDILKLKRSIKFDLIIMFEVLEHIKNEEKTLKKINSLLNKEGLFIISVPSKKKEWGYSDELAGHLRRYEKKELKNLLRNNGFEIIEFYSYGFPWLNIIKYFRDLIAEKKLRRIKNKNNISLTKKSGLNAVGINLPFMKLYFNKYSLFIPMKISSLFNNKDLAEGYLCLSKKL